MLEKFKEIYSYKEMIRNLVKKELRGRYQSSVLGFLWTFLNPLFQIIIYTIVFSTIMRSGMEQFYLYLAVGMIPWMFFSSSVQGGAMCIVSQQDLVKKIYFPREVLPVSYVTSCFVNMLFCFVIVFLMLEVSGKGMEPAALLYLPAVMGVEYLLALGFAMLASAFTVYFRDLEHILGVVLQAWIYLTPIMYPMEMIPARMTAVFQANPMTAVIEAYHTILYDRQVPHLVSLGGAFLTGIGLLAAGSMVFDRLQKGFAEEL